MTFKDKRLTSSSSLFASSSKWFYKLPLSLVKYSCTEEIKSAQHHSELLRWVKLSVVGLLCHGLEFLFKYFLFYFEISFPALFCFLCFVQSVWLVDTPLHVFVLSSVCFEVMSLCLSLTFWALLPLLWVSVPVFYICTTPVQVKDHMLDFYFASCTSHSGPLILPVPWTQ